MRTSLDAPAGRPRPNFLTPLLMIVAPIENHERQGFMFRLIATVAVPVVALVSLGGTQVEASTPPDDPYPIAAGASGPAVAAIQGRLGITVDCDFGNQTARAVEEWQESAGLEVSGAVDELAWALLDVPTTWGLDADASGTIEPGEVTLVCDGDVELPPPPVDTTGWPDTELALVAEICGVPDEWSHPDDDSPDYRYSPSDDSITVYGAGAEDYPAQGEAVFDTMICVLGLSGVPDRVISQLSSTRALDGMQFAEWGDLAAQWTYHPDAGMNLTIWST